MPDPGAGAIAARSVLAAIRDEIDQGTCHFIAREIAELGSMALQRRLDALRQGLGGRHRLGMQRDEGCEARTSLIEIERSRVLIGVFGTATRNSCTALE